MASFNENVKNVVSLSEEASIRFDRQIRVWGAEAQARIQASHVLICGLRGLHPEVIKNIVLAGVSITIQDDNNVDYNDLASNFFLNINDIGSKITTSSLSRIRSLNNFATVNEELKSLHELSDDFFNQFPVIMMCNENDEEQILRVSNLCRQKNSIFFTSIAFGEEGFFFQDFGTNFNYKDDPPNNKDVKTLSFHPYEYMIKKKWSELITRLSPINTTFVKSRLLVNFRKVYGKLPMPDDYDKVNAMAITMLKENNIEDEKFLTSLNLKELCNTSIGAPVMLCSVLGSFLGQQVIKAVSLSGHPGNQIFVFSCHDYVTKAIHLPGAN